MMSEATWTTEQLLGLAPDALLARAAERLAQPQGWRVLGRAGPLVWGVFANAHSSDNHTALTWPELALACDCASRKWPCRHAVALAALFAAESGQFATGVPPEWVECLALHENSALVATEASHSGSQLRAVQRGMAQLDTWLRDIVHRGLADLEGRPAAFWREMAARLVDAQAPLTAQEVRELGKLPGDRANWPEELLRRLGRLYLLAQGYGRYDQLSPEAQADLRGASGWFADPAQPGTETAGDTWLVLGSTAVYDGQDHWRRTWLWGARARRFAYLEETARGAPRPSLISGATVRATLRFAPGGWPARAHLLDLDVVPAAAAAPPRGYADFAAARAAYGRALSLNPWLQAFPLLLHGPGATLVEGRWELYDAAGQRLPLPPGFQHGWHLQALGDGHSALFGEWDGRVLTPLTIARDGAWLPLHALRGQV